MPDVSDIAMLTGAGFTKNFGGFLTDEMWARIYNNPQIQISEKLRSGLQGNLNFEDFYSKVIENEEDEFTQEEQTTFIDAVRRAYIKLDEQVTRFGDAHPDFFNLANLKSRLFVPSTWCGQERMLLFTLNQDLFMERCCGTRATAAPLFDTGLYGNMSHIPAEVVLPSEQDVTHEELLEKIDKSIQDTAGISLIKLHGSLYWMSSDGSGNPGMAIGINKPELIEKEPLLNAYFSKLESFIQEGNKKLVVIGYGFRDKHLNIMLLDGVQNHNLKLFVVHPRSPASFLRSLEDAMDEQTGGGQKKIWESLGGYFPYTLREVFHENSDTVAWREIRETLG